MGLYGGKKWDSNTDNFTNFIKLYKFINGLSI